MMLFVLSGVCIFAKEASAENESLRAAITSRTVPDDNKWHSFTHGDALADDSNGYLFTFGKNNVRSLFSIGIIEADGTELVSKSCVNQVETSVSIRYSGNHSHYCNGAYMM